MKWPVLFLALASCDRLLGLNEVTPLHDAAIDAVVLAHHDEDGDGIDDAIDLCPADFDQTMPQPDADGDGVGDACDPHPDLAIDRIAYFDPLLGFGPWHQVSGTWTDSDDSASAAFNSGTSIALLEHEVSGGEVFQNPTIEVWVSGASTSAEFGAMLATSTVDAPPPLPTGVYCYDNQPTGKLAFLEGRAVAGENIEFDASWSPELPARIVAKGNSEVPNAVPNTLGGPVFCLGYSPAGSRTASVSNDMYISPITSGKVGLYVSAGNATFTSVTVFDTR